MNKMEKYYFFRDLRHDDNFENNTSYHATGIVKVIFNSIEEATGDKDLLVRFIHPFSGEVQIAWRTYSEVDLMKVGKDQWWEIEKKMNYIEHIVNLMDDALKYGVKLEDLFELPKTNKQ